MSTSETTSTGRRGRGGAMGRGLASALIVCARGAALFFGLFALANAAALLFGSGLSQNIWWIDLSLFGSVPAALLQVVSSVFLVWYAIMPHLSLWRRVATAILSGLLTVAAFWNVITFYTVVGSGQLYAAQALPMSLGVAVVMLVVTVCVICFSRRRSTALSFIAMLLVALLLAVVFPLGQMNSYGKTDYRRQADVAVVLGARVRSDNSLSAILKERVDTAIKLYKDGYVSHLIMSGGIEDGEIDEAKAMRDYAVAQGVPDSTIVVDSYGDNTDATVSHTIEICDEKGWDTILAVSSFYHLPRIKMAFLAKGVDIYTVPATPQFAMPKLPEFMTREIPAWWIYWARGSFSSFR